MCVTHSKSTTVDLLVLVLVVVHVHAGVDFEGLVNPLLSRGEFSGRPGASRWRAELDFSVSSLDV